MHERVSYAGLSPLSKAAYLLDTLHCISIDERALGALEVEPYEQFFVYTQFPDFRSATKHARTTFDRTSGVLSIISDLDNTFRTQKKLNYLLTGMPGRVTNDELQYGAELQNDPDIDLIIWTEQPRNGLQVARKLSRQGKRYEFFPDCFRKNGILYLASYTRGPFYLTYKNTRRALREVSSHLKGTYGLSSIAQIACIGDKFTDVLAALHLYRYIKNRYTEDIPVDAYWLRK